MKNKRKDIAWNNANYCICYYDDCHPNNHRICFICDKKMLWGSYWGNKEQQNSRFSWDIDHKVPLSKGGKDNLDNLIAVHAICNRLKGNK